MYLAVTLYISVFKCRSIVVSSNLFHIFLMCIFSCDCEQNPATPYKNLSLKSGYPFLDILGRLMEVFKNILPTSHPLSLHLIPCKLFSGFDYFTWR